MDILFKRISAQQGTPLVQNIANGMETIMTFVLLVSIGLVLQFNVPKLAKIAGISASGAAKDIAGTGAAAGLFIAALKPAIGILKLPISAPVGAVKATTRTFAAGRQAKQFTNNVSQRVSQSVRSKFGPRGPRTPRPE